MNKASKYYAFYQTPDGFDNLVMLSDGNYLNAIYFVLDKKEIEHIMCNFNNKSLPIFSATCQLLDEYFNGENPDFTPLINNCFYSSLFQKEVLEITMNIPYGKTMTYGDIASLIAFRKHKNKMSSQAVGNALKNNPLMILIPCHRVVGKNGKLIGYHGGLNNKSKLLALEQKNYLFDKND